MMNAAMRSVPVSPSCVLITVTRSQRLRISCDGRLGEYPQFAFARSGATAKTGRLMRSTHKLRT